MRMQFCREMDLRSLRQAQDLQRDAGRWIEKILESLAFEDAMDRAGGMLWDSTTHRYVPLNMMKDPDSNGFIMRPPLVQTK